MSANGSGNGGGYLRDEIEDARQLQGCSMSALTVLAPQNDPYRQDTPTGHRDGAWLASNLAEILAGDRRLHLRGAHYALLSAGAVKPNGEPYRNTDADWAWLVNCPAKAARWLGYVPFEQIVDARNSEPVIVIRSEDEPEPWLDVGLAIDIPDVDDLEPRIDVEGFTGIQPYNIGIYGEKTSLADVLGPLAKHYGASLYLPAGEISDTLLYKMAAHADDDGRPFVLLTFSDSDPAGWQMPVSIARKLQALRSGFFFDLDFAVYRVALTPGHVRQYGLPSTPLKETERRADAWLKATGTMQTEIDALATLQRDTLRSIARAAIRPFFDTSLERRVKDARDAWLAEAQARLDAGLDAERRERLHADAAAKLDAFRTQLDELDAELRAEVPDIDLPPIEIPDPEVTGNYGLPLIDSDDDWASQTFDLIASKRYQDVTP